MIYLLSSRDLSKKRAVENMFIDEALEWLHELRIEDLNELKVKYEQLKKIGEKNN